jgi:hypothetical protein
VETDFSLYSPHQVKLSHDAHLFEILFAEDALELARGARITLGDGGPQRVRAGGRRRRHGVVAGAGVGGVVLGVAVQQVEIESKNFETRISHFSFTG